MNAFLLAALVLMTAGLLPCLVAVSRGGALDRLVALELASVVAVIVALLLAQGFGRPSYLDVGLVLALLSFAGPLVFARFLEHWR